jgi:HD-like signal output (HDOD) protein
VKNVYILLLGFALVRNLVMDSYFVVAAYSLLLVTPCRRNSYSSYCFQNKNKLDNPMRV